MEIHDIPRHSSENTLIFANIENCNTTIRRIHGTQSLIGAIRAGIKSGDRPRGAGIGLAAPDSACAGSAPAAAAAGKMLSNALPTQPHASSFFIAFIFFHCAMEKGFIFMKLTWGQTEHKEQRKIIQY